MEYINIKICKIYILYYILFIDFYIELILNFEYAIIIFF